MFKRKAEELQALTKALAPASRFLLNPGEYVTRGRAGSHSLAMSLTPPPPVAVKPRKGYFEVRVGPETIVSLASMPRPFVKLRGLDMAATAAAAAKVAGGGGASKKAKA